MAPGVSYPQPDAPKYSATPEETFAPNPLFPRSVMYKYGPTALGAVGGALTVACQNYYTKRPYLSGIHRYPIAVLIGAAAIYQFQKYKESQWAERDAVLRHYISLHPEDFPPYKQVKLGDIFDEWYPIR